MPNGSRSRNCQKSSRGIAKMFSITWDNTTRSSMGTMMTKTKIRELAENQLLAAQYYKHGLSVYETKNYNINAFIFLE